MVKLVIAIVAILLVVGAGAYFSWSYADYIITGWNWVTTAFNALLAGVPDWAYPFFAAALLLAFLGILVKVLG